MNFFKFTLCFPLWFFLLLFPATACEEGNLILEKQIFEKKETLSFSLEGVLSPDKKIFFWLEDDQGNVLGKKMLSQKTKTVLSLPELPEEWNFLTLFVELSSPSCSFTHTQKIMIHNPDASSEKLTSCSAHQVYSTGLSRIGKTVPWLLLALACVLSITLLVFQEW